MTDKDLDPNFGGDAEFSQGIVELAAVIKVHSPLRTLSETMGRLPDGRETPVKAADGTILGMKPPSIVLPNTRPRKLAHAVIDRLRAGLPMTLEESNRLADLLEGLLDPDAKHYDLSAVKETLRAQYHDRRKLVANSSLPKETEDETAKVIVKSWNDDPLHTQAGILVKKPGRLDHEKLIDWLKHPND